MSPSTVKSTRKVSSEEVLNLWSRYKATGDRAVRNRLVLSLTPLVKYIVYKKIRELPARCEVDDFVACGLEAVLGSIDRYDPSRGASLEQFVWTRIHGAVLDELRRMDWAPRSLRRWERDIARARERFTSTNGRRPSASELAGELGISVDDLRKHEDNIALSDTTSLNNTIGGDEDSTIERIDAVADDRGEFDPERATYAQEAKEHFREAFRRLSTREREVAVMLYVKNMTLRDVGETLGVSESRICQLHTQLKATLRRDLAPHEQLFASVG